VPNPITLSRGNTFWASFFVAYRRSATALGAGVKANLLYAKPPPMAIMDYENTLSP
jgi:hypothetical protein